MSMQETADYQNSTLPAIGPDKPLTSLTTIQTASIDLRSTEKYHQDRLFQSGGEEVSSRVFLTKNQV